MPYGRPRSQMPGRRDERLPGLLSPYGFAKVALEEFQSGPKIQRPSLAQSFIPVVGPAWEAAADLQEGDYAGAAFNGAMAVVDVLPVGVAAKGARAAARGVGVLKKGSVSADAARKQLKARGVVPPKHEVHHSLALNGKSRTAQDPRNHFALLKVLPQEQHRRLHGSWKGKPRYDPIRRVWYGTTDWQKAVPTGAVGRVADSWENVSQSSRPQGRPRTGR